MVITGPTDVGVKDRGRLRGAFRRRLPIKLVVEDGFDRAVGPGADFDGALGGGFETCDAEGTGEAEDAQTGAVALLGMRPALQNLLAERRGRRADLAGVFPDALDRPEIGRASCRERVLMPV